MGSRSVIRGSRYRLLIWRIEGQRIGRFASGKTLWDASRLETGDRVTTHLATGSFKSRVETLGNSAEVSFSPKEKRGE